MGLSIQNEDVKSKEELQALGASPDHLINDKKIWVTANNILKPLDQAITDGDIGAEVGVGSAYRHRTIVYGDGSTEEYGAKFPPYLDVNGDTVIETDYVILDKSFVKVNVDKKEWIEYISDATTPDFWWKKISDSKILIKGDHTQLPIRIEVQVMDGVDLPPILSSLYAGLDLIGEAYGYVDYSNSSSNVTNVSVVNGKTQITIGTNFTKDDYVFVYINNEYYVPFKLGITTSKYYKQIDPNIIELDGNYTGQSLPFYIAVFKGKFLQDELGNICFTIGANIRAYSIESPDLTLWGLGVNDLGEFFADNVIGSLIPADPIRLLRDDNTIVALEISNSGAYSINDTPLPGVLFSHLHLVSPNGIMWHLGVSNTNVIYLDDTELSSNKFCLQDNHGNVIHEIQNTTDGAIFKLRHFNKGSLPANPSQLTQSTLIAIEQDAITGPRMMQYNTFEQIWKPISGDAKNVPIGEVKTSIHQVAQFKQIYGNDWEIMDGTVQLQVSLYTEFAALVPDWHDGSVITIPDANNYDIEPQTFNKYNGVAANHATNGTRLPPPPGFTVGDHWAGLSSLSRVYWAGGVDFNDTTVNDYHLDTTGSYTNAYNSEQRAGAYTQMFSLYRKLKKEKRYIKVR